MANILDDICEDGPVLSAEMARPKGVSKATVQRCISKLSPYSLQHGYAYRGALAGIPLRQLAASMGHDVRTHMKHYGQWTDEAGLDAAFGAANAKLTASPTQRQQKMQQQQ